MAHISNIIDADGHLRDTEREYREYIEEPYRSRRRVGPGAGGGGGFDNTLGQTLGTWKVTPQIWLDLLDKAGVETTVLYPTSGLGLGQVREADYAVALCRAYNNFVAEEYLKTSSRLQAVALLPPQDPIAATEELRRAVQVLGLKGAMLPSDGPYLLGKPQFHPIYQEAERLGCAIAIHGSGQIWDGVDQYQMDKFIQVHSISHPFSQMRQITSVMFEGVFERFPKLKIAFLEAGCTWVPFLLDRMDEKYELRGKVEAPLLKKKPSEYVRHGSVYFSIEAEETLLPEVMKFIGDSHILFASDFPHWDSSFPHNMEELLERQDLSDEQKTRIMRDNAKEFYALP